MDEELKIKINYNIEVTDDPDAEDVLVDYCGETNSGAPMFNVILSKKHVMSMVEP